MRKISLFIATKTMGLYPWLEADRICQRQRLRAGGSVTKITTGLALWVCMLFAALPVFAVDNFSSVVSAVDEAAKNTPKSMQNKNPKAAKEKTFPTQKANLKEKPVKPLKKIPLPTARPRVITVVIDPGHGGKDSGAVGLRGTLEKDITLNYAKALKKSLDEYFYFKTILTHAGGKYVALRDRVKVAQANKADLFISLHADSHPEKKVKGLSVYTLSNTASDKEAERLSKAENNEVIAGVNLSREDKEAAEVIVDLVKDDTMNNSAIFAETIAAELSDEIRLLENTHRYAGFAVLTGLDVPSALVELGYLSNEYEEKMLNTEEYKTKLVAALSHAIVKYFDGRF